MANAFSWYVPSYVQYLATCDMRPAYADHQRWLRALLYRRQRSQGDLPRLALKDPFHMWHLDALLAVYPDATIIQLHREPAEIVPSFASLCASLQSVDTDSLQSALQADFDARFPHEVELVRAVHEERDKGIHRWSRFERADR